MKKLVLSTSAVVLAFFSLASAASAQSAGSVTFNGSLGYTQFGGGDDEDDASLGAITGRVGARFHPNFGIEGELGFGVQGEEFDTTVGQVDVDLDYHAGAYLVGIVPVSPNFELFGRLGYATLEVSASGAGVTVSEGADGVAIGAGASYYFDGVNGIRGDYTRIEGDDDLAADVWALAYTRRF